MKQKITYELKDSTKKDALPYSTGMQLLSTLLGDNTNKASTSNQAILKRSFHGKLQAAWQPNGAAAQGKQHINKPATKSAAHFRKESTCPT
ncbi:hypothetical protein [Vogesella indigofera]|uniref:hypothetical protein n=1 Tax=Vogesella indigofera TaxID=45465 RepID=UPI00234C5903|nr:hypothetical protein [Vogesella indigofera]MDC7704385.1 hypothetical protein [Vogesella indigofera]